MTVISRFSNISMGRHISDRNTLLLEETLRRVRELFSEAERGRMHCMMVVAVGFKDGVAQQLNDERKRYGEKNAE